MVLSDGNLAAAFALTYVWKTVLICTAFHSSRKDAQVKTLSNFWQATDNRYRDDFGAESCNVRLCLSMQEFPEIELGGPLCARRSASPGAEFPGPGNCLSMALVNGSRNPRCCIIFEGEIDVLIKPNWAHEHPIAAILLHLLPVHVVTCTV